MTRQVTCLFLLILLSACSHYKPYVISTTPIGMVSASTGFPSVLRNARPYILDEQSQLYQGDVITTDEQSLVHINFNSGATLELGTQSQLLLSQYSEIRHQRLHGLSLSKGSMTVSRRAGDFGVAPVFEIATTIATVESRGDNFWLGYTPASNGVDVVSLTHEPVTVRNKSGSIELNQPLQMTTVTPGGAPQAMLVWSEKKFERRKKPYTRVTR